MKKCGFFPIFRAIPYLVAGKNGEHKLWTARRCFPLRSVILRNTSPFLCHPEERFSASPSSRGTLPFLCHPEEHFPFFVILRSTATKDLLLQRRGRHRGKILRSAQDDRRENLLRFFVILRSTATKDLLLQRHGGHRGKILRCAQDDRRGNLLRFFVILRSAATKDLLLQRHGRHREKILRCAQDDKEGKFAQVLCHPEEHSDEGSSSPKARRAQGKDPSLCSG